MVASIRSKGHPPRVHGRADKGRWPVSLRSFRYHFLLALGLGCVWCSRATADPPPVPAETPVESAEQLDDGSWYEPYGDGQPYVPAMQGPLHNGYARFEMLLWWRGGQDVPPLATTSPAGTAQGIAGVLGNPTTTILAGGQKITDDARIGGRVTVGQWFDPYQVNGVVVRFFTLGEDSSQYQFTDSQYSILGRPIINASTSAEDARLVTYPGISAGTITIDANSNISGGDVLARLSIARYHGLRMDLLGGYQASRIDEGLQVVDVLTSLDPGGSVPVGTVITTDDRFATRNQFHGGVVGLIIEGDRGVVTWTAMAKLGLGNMRQNVTIAGTTTTVIPAGGTTTTTGGLLALPTNIGSYEQDKFALVPEFTLGMRWRMSPHASLSAGYNFIYWSEVARPGEQIDRVVNLTQVPGPIVGPARPAFPFNSGGLLVHGFQFGLQLDY